MAIVAADWTIDRDTKVISYIGDDHTGSAPSYATVIEFHRWLQSLADDAVAVPSSSDELDITNVDPSRRSTDNIITLINSYKLDVNAPEHLYDGSVIQGTIGVDQIIWDGIVNFGNSDVQIQIIQNGEVLADDWWNCRDKVQGDGGLNYNDNSGISHRFMLKVHDYAVDGGDIDGRRIIGTARRFNYTYQEFKINGSSRGNNVLALADATDLNNQTIEATVSGWTGITLVTEGYKGLDINDDSTLEYFYSEWNTNYPSRTINNFYERMKWLTRDGSSSTLYGLNGELFRGITHEIAISSPTGTFVEPEELDWAGATPGTGQLLAIDSTTAGTKMWIQILTGQAPSGGVTINGASATAVQGTVTDRSALISKPFIGVSTGTQIIGAYGIGIQPSDINSGDKLFDLANVQWSPPNLVTNSVTGLVSGEDYVLVAPWDGTSYDTNGDPAIKKDQLSLDLALTINDITQVEVTESIPLDTPSTGYIRVIDNNGFERRLHYSGWENGTPNYFTIDTTDGNEDFLSVNASIGNDVYIAYIDKLADSGSLSYQGTYVSDRNLVVIVRDGGGSPIKQFISAWTFLSSGQSISVIRTTDA